MESRGGLTLVTVSTMKDTKESYITIYKDGFGVIKEKRQLDLTSSEDQIVQYLDVAQQIETDSLIVHGLEISEFNYDYDFIDQNKILNNYLDNTVYLYDKASNTKTECTLLSTKGGIVLENKHTKKIIINPSEELVLPKLPQGLISKPALIWKVKNVSEKEIGVSYITKGLNWTANYVLLLRENECKLVGWVNVSNTSGTTYENTKIKLVAGEANKPNYCRTYGLENSTTLKDHQDKKINYCSLTGIRYKKYYELEENNTTTYKAIIELDQHHRVFRDMLLPKGTVKVYREKKDDDSIEYLGEDIIEYSPDNPTLRLEILEPSDLVCKLDRIEHKRQGGYELEELVYRIRNYRKEDIRIKINSRTITNGTLIDSTHLFERSSSRQLELWLDIKANQQEIVSIKYKKERGLFAG